MTTGALIFAFNNEHIDYVSMAAWSAANIHRHLDIPVCVVTDSDTEDPIFDRIIRINRTHTDQQREFADIDGRMTWYNQDRVDAYTLSPWDQTLVLDADYVVAGRQMATLLEDSRPFLCHRLAWDTVAGKTLDNLNYFGSSGMPMWWATVMMFHRDPVAQYVFDSMKMVRDNWQHYKSLYGIKRGHYRNDFALSISLGIVSGHTLKVDSIPWNLATIMPGQQISQLAPDHYQINFEKDGKARYLTIGGLDFHAMGKGQLGAIIANQC